MHVAVDRCSSVQKSELELGINSLENRSGSEAVLLETLRFRFHVLYPANPENCLNTTILLFPESKALDHHHHDGYDDNAGDREDIK